METLCIYFLKANGLLITFFFAYYFLLRKETFFNKNRWFLLFGLFTSVLLPLVTFTKTVWIEPNHVVYENPSQFEDIPYVIVNQIKEEPIDWSSIFVYTYLFIITIFILKILIEILSFIRIVKFGKRTKTNEAILIDNDRNENPFSFFNHIVFNSQMFTVEELQHIISHENIHVKENHSIDVLLGKLFCAVFWINPIMWFYRKEMLQNLEYIADNKASSIAQNRINYQKTLLKVVTNQHQLSITNQFYQSLIKKRIVMLNTNPSNQRKSWKYALILPVLSAFLLLFQVETVAQVKSSTQEIASYAVSTNYSSTITKNTTDEELKELEKTFSNEKRKLIISDVKRNKKGEINEIKLLFDTGKTYHRVLHRKSSESIDDIQIFVKTDEKGNENCDFIETDKELAAFMETSEKVASYVEFESSSYVFFDNDSHSYRESIMKKVLDENVKSLLFFNDKEISKNEVFKIKGNLIEEIIEISPNGSSISKYGEKGKNGVVLIYSKKFSNNSKNIGITWDEAQLNSEKNKSEKNRLYIINGNQMMQNEIPKGTTISLDGTVIEMNAEEGIKKYGQKAKDGVLIFEGKSILVKGKEEKPQIGYGITYETETYSSEDNISSIKEDKSVDFKKALIFLNNKKISYKELDKINSNSISQVISFNGSEKVIQKYGPEAKEGVILINTETPILVNETNTNEVDFKLENNNSGFIISKKSRDEDLDFYKNTLEKSEIKFTYKNIKRNINKEITSITLFLERGLENIELKIKSNDPIDQYFIGTENDKIIIRKKK